MDGHLAQVYDVLPARHGVLVTFRDGTYSCDTERTFCRVLAPRAHPKGGSSTGLPQVGELGVVVELAGGFLVWLGSLHYQAEAENQVEPEEGARVSREDSGVVHRSRSTGESEWTHPSGLRLTVSDDGAPMPALKRPGISRTVNIPAIELEHPSGVLVSISPEGDLAVKGCASVTFQDGAKRFCMEDLFTWIKTHKHLGVTAGSGSTLGPATPPPDSSLSPDTFLGPNA